MGDGKARLFGFIIGQVIIVVTVAPAVLEYKILFEKAAAERFGRVPAPMSMVRYLKVRILGTNLLGLFRGRVRK